MGSIKSFDRHRLNFSQQPPRLPSTTIRQHAYERQYGCPTPRSPTDGKRAVPNTCVSEERSPPAVTDTSLRGCAVGAARQHRACTFFSVPRHSHVRGAEAGPGGSGTLTPRGKEPSPEVTLPRSSACLRSLFRKCCCSGRDGFKVTSQSGSACRAGLEGPRSQCSGPRALHGVWRYLARWGCQGPASWPCRGVGVLAQHSGVGGSPPPYPSNSPPAPRASGSAGVSLLFPAAAAAAH